MKRRRKSASKNQDSTAARETPPSAAEFSYAITRVAVSQICRSVGFRAAESSTLETLTLIATKYMQRLAGAGTSLSNAANRTESNLFDIVNGLRDLSSSSCTLFSGGSATDADCLIRSNVLRDLSDFVGSSPEIPFAKPVPRRRNGGDVFSVPHAPPQASYVPVWLPSFPDASFYRESSCVKERSDRLWEESDPARERFFFSDDETPPEISKSGGCGGRRGGDLPGKRERVTFKLGKKTRSDPTGL